MADKKKRRRFKVPENDLDERDCAPCGERSPLQDWLSVRGIHEQQTPELDVTRHYLSDRKRRDQLLRQITAALPLMTERQRTIIGMFGQGQTYRQIAARLSVHFTMVQKEMEAARAVILSMDGIQDEQSAP